MTPTLILLIVAVLVLINALACAYSAAHARSPLCPEPRRNGWLYNTIGGAGTTLLIVAGLHLHYGADMAWMLTALLVVMTVTAVTVGRAIEIHRNCKVWRRWRRA